MDLDSFTVRVKMEYMYADLAGDVKKRFDTSNYKSKEDWTDETWIRWKIMKEIVAPKT